MKHNLDGFVVEGRAYLLKASRNYQAYLKTPNPLTVDVQIDSVSASDRSFPTS